MVEFRAKQAMQDEPVKTAKRTLSASGKQGYQGTESLRETEQPD